MKYIQIFLFLYYLHDIGQCGESVPDIIKMTDELAMSNSNGVNQNRQSNFRHMYLPISNIVSVYKDNNVGFGYRVQNGNANVWVSSNIYPWMNVPVHNNAWNTQHDTSYYYPNLVESETNLKPNIIITNGHPFSNSVSQIYKSINQKMYFNPSEVNDLSNDESSIHKVSTGLSFNKNNLVNSSKLSDQVTSPSTYSYSKKNSSIVEILNRNQLQTNIPDKMYETTQNIPVMNNFHMLKPSIDMNIKKSMNIVPNKIVVRNTATMENTGVSINSKNVKPFLSPMIIPNAQNLQQNNFQMPETHKSLNHVPLMQNIQVPNTSPNVQKIQIPLNFQMKQSPNMFSTPASQNFQQQHTIPNVRIINPISIQKISVPRYMLHISPSTKTQFSQNAESMQKIVQTPLNYNFVQVLYTSPLIRVPVLQSYHQPILNHSPVQPNIPVPYQKLAKKPRSLLPLISSPQNNYVYEPIKPNPMIDLQMLINRDKRSFDVNNNEEDINRNAFQRFWLNGHGYANGEIRNIVANNYARKSRYLESTPNLQHSFDKNVEQ